ncbi:MAG: MFS transporter [Pseudonocardiaceae bacterium]|nr:MFS transporter [Pseudonocardiaceae bacterium]
MTSAQQGAAGAEPDTSTVRKAVGAAAIGNATEWFDFAAYSYVVVYIGANFFPESSDTARTLEAFIVFAASFLLRPLGGLFFGPLGDRIGRKPVLALTILLMAGATFAIGVLPTYDQVGFWAPALLVAARMVQGFSTGGEYGGAATFMSEYAPYRRRGFFGSFLEFGTLGGFTLGAVISTVLITTLSDEAITGWGWRVPFLVALPLGIIGLYLRLKLDETPAFQEQDVDSREDSPLKDLCVNHWRDMLTCFGFVVLLNIAVYTMLTYMPTYLTQVLDISETTGLVLIIIAQLGMMAVILPMGALSDRIGRKPLLLTGCLGFLVFSWPAFKLLSLGNAATTALGLVILSFFLVCLLCLLGGTLPAIFDTRVRYGGFAISYNVSTSIFGGTAPAVVAFMIEQSGNQFIPAYYLMAAALVGLVPILMMKETAGKPLRGTVAERELAEQGP